MTTPPNQPDRILLVPGFTSPRWMLYPLYCYLRYRFSHVTNWGYPAVFSQLEANVIDLGARLQTEFEAGQQIALVTHSFGDWVARAALAAVPENSVQRLVSIGPVVTAAPLARLAQHFTRSAVPEIRVMANDRQASAFLTIPEHVDHIVLWARWEWLVKRPAGWPGPRTRLRLVRGTHNSLVFQPHVWRMVTEYLRGRDLPAAVGS